MVTDAMELRLGEERPVRLPLPAQGQWDHEIEGMASAVSIRRLWRALPYPEDDEEEPRPADEVVFMVRGVNPGRAVVRFVAPDGRGAREVQVDVRR